MTHSSSIYPAVLMHYFFEEIVRARKCGYDYVIIRPNKKRDIHHYIRWNCQTIKRVIGEKRTTLKLTDSIFDLCWKVVGDKLFPKDFIADKLRVFFFKYFFLYIRVCTEFTFVLAKHIQ